MPDLISEEFANSLEWQVSLVALLIVTLVSLFVLGVGLLGLGSPAGMVAFVSRWRSKAGLWVASVLRLVFGVALWFVAPMSRTPLALQVLAIVSVFAALALPVIGLSRVDALLAWWCRQSPAFTRAWSVVAAVLGLFLLWSVIS